MVFLLNPGNALNIQKTERDGMFSAGSEYIPKKVPLLLLIESVYIQKWDLSDVGLVIGNEWFNM